MVVSISRPDLLTILDDITSQSYFGGTQDWYAAERRRRAGCGPTAAANLTAYLALSRPGLRPLYPYDRLNPTDFTRSLCIRRKPGCFPGTAYFPCPG